MTSRKQIKDSERWRAVGRIEAGQSITDVALFFGVHHSVISRLWIQFQTTQTVVRKPVGGHRRIPHRPASFKRGSVTAVRYRDEVLEPIVRLYAAAVGPTFVLINDNTRPHRADIVDDYLESEGIARIPWPAYLPDLNPIENLWDALGRTISSRFPSLATLIELETALQV
ncbi:transposable element Tcb1 transposase [Trichonephila clavipes]|nr:transposable element Tcb1 transposase [Trichonephila clavipes]